MKIDEPLLARFLAYSSAKGNTAKWVADQRRHLLALRKALRGADLRGLELRRLLPHVAGRGQRIAVIKALYSYLRRVTFEITPAEDPTLNRLRVPQRQPSAENRAVPRAAIDRVLHRLPGRWRAILELQAATGLHTTEMQRFAKGGRLERYAGQEGAVAYLCVPHKNGQEHRVALDARLAAVAECVRRAGPFDLHPYHDHVRAAGADFTPGRMRHTVATELVNAGHDIATVATFLGHRSPLTTRRWYAKFAVPRNPTLARPGARRVRRPASSTPGRSGARIDGRVPRGRGTRGR